MGNRWMTGRRNFAGLEIKNTIGGKLAIKEPHTAGTIGLVRHPDKAIRTNPEQIGSVIVTVLNTKT
jgi:hypothetical protein